jgi:hypothetical protein
MTTIHTRQIQFTSMHVGKTTLSEESPLYIISNNFSPYCAFAFFTPVLHFSPLHHPYIPFPLHPTFPLSYAALHYTSLHITTLLDDFHFTSSHYTFKFFFSTLFCLTHIINRFLSPLFQSVCFTGESS